MKTKQFLIWSAVLIGISLGFTVITKLLTFILDSDMIKIIINAMFTGVGTAIGIWIGSNHVIEKLKVVKEKIKRKRK